MALELPNSVINFIPTARLRLLKTYEKQMHIIDTSSPGANNFKYGNEISGT